MNLCLASEFVQSRSNRRQNHSALINDSSAIAISRVTSNGIHACIPLPLAYKYGCFVASKWRDSVGTSQSSIVIVEGSVHLHDACNALYEPKDQGQSEDQYCYPECIPLDSIPTVIPPLRKRSRCCLIEELLQHDQAVMPVEKFLNLAVVGLQMSARHQLGVKVRAFATPVTYFCICLGEK